MADYSVVLFHSTSHAIRAERVLEGAGIPIKMIPTPRQISSNCGMALRFDQSDSDHVKNTLSENNVPINGIHTLQN